MWEKTDNMPYERVSVSFTLPENAEPKVYCMAYCDMQNGFAGGNCWFDAMQLEEGLTLNHFNMVQNSDFSADRHGRQDKGMDDWQKRCVVC